jgi:hypothetical protein
VFHAHVSKHLPSASYLFQLLFVQGIAAPRRHLPTLGSVPLVLGDFLHVRHPSGVERIARQSVLICGNDAISGTEIERLYEAADFPLRKPE